MKMLQKVPFALFAIVHGSVGIVYLTKGSLGIMTMFDWPGSSEKTEATLLEDLALSMVCSYELVLCSMCTWALLRSTADERRLMLVVEAAVFCLVGYLHTKIKGAFDVGPLILSSIAILSVLLQSSRESDKPKAS